MYHELVLCTGVHDNLKKVKGWKGERWISTLARTDTHHTLLILELLLSQLKTMTEDSDEIHGRNKSKLLQGIARQPKPWWNSFVTKTLWPGADATEGCTLARADISGWGDGGAHRLSLIHRYVHIFANTGALGRKMSVYLSVSLSAGMLYQGWIYFNIKV